MITNQKIQDYLTHLQARGFSQNTLRAYRADLEGLLIHLATIQAPTNFRDLEGECAKYLNKYRQTWAPKTTVRKLGTIRSFGVWLCGGQQPGRDFLANYKPPTPAAHQPHPIPEGIDGVKAMIARTRNPLHKALITLTGLMGLRVDEAIHVLPEHFDLIEMTLKIRGKGDKTRVIPISDVAWSHLHGRYIDACAADAAMVPYTNSGARKAITRHGRNAGLSRPISSHDMRATLATAAYRNSKDLRAVQELLGHADARTTQVYTEVSMESMRSAVNVG